MSRILYIWKSPYPWDVRIEKTCKSLGKAGYDVYLMVRWEANQSEFEDNGDFKIIRVGKRIPGTLLVPVSYNPVWRLLIRVEVERLKPDLIISREIMLAEAAADIARQNNTPHIIDMAEHYPAAMKGWKKYSENYIRRILVHYLNVPELVEKRSIMKADGIITVCLEQNERLHREYNYSHEKMQVVHNTPELSWFANTKVGLSIPPKNFAYHGYISPDRNLDVMIKAFALAVKKDENINLILSGSQGEGYDDLIQISESSGISDKIRFTGAYNHSEIEYLYSNMDIGLLPYKSNIFINHTISNKLFDYMAVGKPVIVSQAAPMVRIINETGAGIIADCTKPERLAESILNIKNADLTTMSKNGIEFSRSKYNWDVDFSNLNAFLKKYL